MERYVVGTLNTMHNSRSDREPLCHSLSDVSDGKFWGNMQQPACACNVSRVRNAK